jgi:hypothetical protein
MLYIILKIFKYKFIYAIAPNKTCCIFHAMLIIENLLHTETCIDVHSDKFVVTRLLAQSWLNYVKWTFIQKIYLI